MAKQSGFDLILDVADRERTDSLRSGTGKRGAVVLDTQSFDSGWRHRIDVGGDLKLLGGGKLLGRDHLNPGATGTEHDLGLADQPRLEILAAAVGVGQLDVEACLRIFGALLDPRGPVIADQSHGRAFEPGDDACGIADYPCRAEHGNSATGPVGAEIRLQLPAHAGDHGRRSRE